MRKTVMVVKQRQSVTFQTGLFLLSEQTASFTWQVWVVVRNHDSKHDAHYKFIYFLNLFMCNIELNAAEYTQIA